MKSQRSAKRLKPPKDSSELDALASSNNTKFLESSSQMGPEQSALPQRKWLLRMESYIRRNDEQEDEYSRTVPGATPPLVQREQPNKKWGLFKRKNAPAVLSPATAKKNQSTSRDMLPLLPMEDTFRGANQVSPQKIPEQRAAETQALVRAEMRADMATLEEVREINAEANRLNSRPRHSYPQLSHPAPLQ